MNLQRSIKWQPRITLVIQLIVLLILTTLLVDVSGIPSHYPSSRTDPSLRRRQLQEGSEGDGVAAEASCSRVNLLPPKERCAFVTDVCAVDQESRIPYQTIYYCHVAPRGFVLGSVFISLLGLLLLPLLFTLLGDAADLFFSPVMALLAQTLPGIRPRFAGVTFVAVGNGAPDLSSNASALRAGNVQLAMGALTGAAMFVQCVVAGEVIRQARPPARTLTLTASSASAATDTEPPPLSFGPSSQRDSLVYMAALLLVMGSLAAGKVTRWHVMGASVLYGIYVTWVYLGDHWHARGRPPPKAIWRETKRRGLGFVHGVRLMARFAKSLGQRSGRRRAARRFVFLWRRLLRLSPTDGFPRSPSRDAALAEISKPLRLRGGGDDNDGNGGDDYTQTLRSWSGEYESDDESFPTRPSSGIGFEEDLLGSVADDVGSAADAVSSGRAVLVAGPLTPETLAMAHMPYRASVVSAKERLPLLASPSPGPKFPTSAPWVPLEQMGPGLGDLSASQRLPRPLGNAGGYTGTGGEAAAPGGRPPLYPLALSRLGRKSLGGGPNEAGGAAAGPDLAIHGGGGRGDGNDDGGGGTNGEVRRTRSHSAREEGKQHDGSHVFDRRGRVVGKSAFPQPPPSAVPSPNHLVPSKDFQDMVWADLAMDDGDAQVTPSFADRSRGRGHTGRYVPPPGDLLSSRKDAGGLGFSLSWLPPYHQRSARYASNGGGADALGRPRLWHGGAASLLHNLVTRSAGETSSVPQSERTTSIATAFSDPSPNPRASAATAAAVAAALLPYAKDRSVVKAGQAVGTSGSTVSSTASSSLRNLEMQSTAARDRPTRMSLAHKDVDAAGDHPSKYLLPSQTQHNGRVLQPTPSGGGDWNRRIGSLLAQENNLEFNSRPGSSLDPDRAGSNSAFAAAQAASSIGLEGDDGSVPKNRESLDTTGLNNKSYNYYPNIKNGVAASFPGGDDDAEAGVWETMSGRDLRTHPGRCLRVIWAWLRGEITVGNWDEWMSYPPNSPRRLWRLFSFPVLWPFYLSLRGTVPLIDADGFSKVWILTAMAAAPAAAAIYAGWLSSVRDLAVAVVLGLVVSFVTRWVVDWGALAEYVGVRSPAAPGDPENSAVDPGFQGEEEIAREITPGAVGQGDDSGDSSGSLRLRSAPDHDHDHDNVANNNVCDNHHQRNSTSNFNLSNNNSNSNSNIGAVVDISNGAASLVSIANADADAEADVVAIGGGGERVNFPPEASFPPAGASPGQSSRRPSLRPLVDGPSALADADARLIISTSGDEDVSAAPHPNLGPVPACPAAGRVAPNVREAEEVLAALEFSNPNPLPLGNPRLFFNTSWDDAVVAATAARFDDNGSADPLVAAAAGCGRPGPSAARVLTPAGVLSLVGFAVGLMWMDTLASEAVSVVSLLADVLSVPEGVAGLTLMAWGNSLGDFFGNPAMARRGQANMAFTACVAGPLFNMLLSYAIGFAGLLSRRQAAAAAGGGDGGSGADAVVALSPEVALGGAFLLLYNVILLSVAARNDRKLPSRFHLFSKAWYGLYCISACVIGASSVPSLASS